MANIGKYEIESKIGHGGMGDVYRAFDPTVRRYVAIKVLQVEGDQQLLSRFHLEATSAGNLNHPNIVTIYEYGEHEGKPYIVMEYLEGQDLGQAMESRKLDLVEITDVMAQVADGLECAHAHGVIHRDIKPANIMLTNRGTVKLMDFGIARLTGENSQQTKTGYLIGTVLYMSPEQFQNLELDARVDIWAYGVIYYQLLAGKHPFAVSDQMATMYNIANRPAPPICTLNQEVPEGLGQVVDKCLIKDRDLRYRTMEDLRFDTLPILQDLTKQQTARMVGEARNLLAGDQLDAAQTLVRRVLELEPGDRTAHTLRKTIAEELQRRSLRPKIEGFCNSAEEQMTARQYAKAIELFESALRLDPTAANIKKRAEEARGFLEREKRVEEFLHAARREFGANNLTGAYRNASEVVRADPDHTEAARLLASIQEEIDKRERQRKLQEGLGKAKNLLRIGSYEEAVTVLQALNAEFPGTTEASHLLRDAEAARDEETRRKRLQQELAGARDLLKKQSFQEAVQRLEALAIEFPGEKEFQQLLAYAREEWKIRQRGEALERVKNHIAKLQAEGKFDEALRFLDRGLTEFPGETDLLRLSQSIVSAKADTERRAAVEEALQQARNKQRQGEITEAIRIADVTLRLHGPDGKLLSLREQLEKDWQAAQRFQALQKVLADGRKFIDRREWPQAIQHFQQAVRQHPEEAEPKALLAEAERAFKQQERERAEIDALAQATMLEKQGQLEPALAAIEDGLRAHADSISLAQHKVRLQRNIAEVRAAREREAKLEETRRKALEEQQRLAQEIDQTIQAIESAIGTRDFAQALKLAKVAVKAHPNEERFTGLPAEIERLQQQSKAEECLAKAYAAIGRGELDKAEKLIAEAKKASPNHSGLKDAENDLEAQRARKREAKRITRPPEEKVFTAPPAVPAPAKPFPVKWVAIGAAAAVVLVGAATMIMDWGSGPKPPPPTTVELGPQTVDMAVGAAGSAPEPVSISATGTTGANFLAKAIDSWIEVSPQDGTLPATITVAAKTGGLGVGTHHGTVEVTAGKMTQRLTVNLTVPAPPEKKTEVAKVEPSEVQEELNVSPESLSFQHEVGSPEPTPKTLHIDATGGTRQFQASSREPWLSASPASGTGPGRIGVSVHPTTLKAGKYYGQVIVTGPGGQPHKVVVVVLTVAEGPTPVKETKAEEKKVEEKKAEEKKVEPDSAKQEKTVRCSTFGSRQTGSLTWAGTLAPGATITMGPASDSLQGGGQVFGTRFPAGCAFEVASVAPAGVRAAAEINKLSLVNSTSAPITQITVTWKLK